ncbi:MAG: YraN family protein [Caldisericia bacterium]|nr:YraN family protein [Caldisericia bacterium]
MGRSTKDIGNRGEQIASEWLKRKGFTIISRNYFCKYGEIDIIAEKNYVIHFIEVKTRTNEVYGNPIDSCTPKKIQKIKKTLFTYLEENNTKNKSFQIDFIGLKKQPNGKLLLSFIPYIS